MNITGLHIYPVKGLGGISLNKARIRPRGLQYDREWVIVDDNNTAITQRQAGTMATISTRVSDKFLELHHESNNTLQIPLKHVEGRKQDVTVWSDTCTAVDQGSEAAHWLTTVLASDGLGAVRLMRFAHDGIREVEPDLLNGVPAVVGFADAYPFLVANDATLQELNEALDAQVPMNRFRPNIVVQGLAPRQEHSLSTLRIPARGVRLSIPKPCQRCKVTTINQDTGDIDIPNEPLKTLMHTNPLPGLRGAYFGQNGVLREGDGAEIQVGDEIDAN